MTSSKLVLLDQDSMSRIRSISISAMAQWKMALHATTKPHGCSTAGQPPFNHVVHGIVLGHRVKSSAATAATSTPLVVTDVVPVCRETPTKPMVDMALRLVEAHLLQNKKQQQQQQTSIIGWYTNSSTSNIDCGNDDDDDDDRRNNEDKKNGDDDDELPNASACRILSSMTESSSCDGTEVGEDFVLLSLSNSKLDKFVMNTNVIKNNSSLTLLLCKAFQWETKSRTLVRRKDVVIFATADDDDEQMKEQRLAFPTVVYDFVDHMNDCDFVDSKWIENSIVKNN